MIDPRGLRDVLGCYATGVAILSTRTSAGEHVAVTINSFASLSLEPPLILFSLGKKASILPHVQQASCFAVNVLAHEQERLSNMFARPATAAWDTCQFSEAENGCALFAGSLAWLECSRYAEIDGGDHRTFFAQITQTHLGPAGAPLVFYRGRYGTFTRGPLEQIPVAGGSLFDFENNGWS